MTLVIDINTRQAVEEPGRISSTLVAECKAEFWPHAEMTFEEIRRYKDKPPPTVTFLEAREITLGMWKGLQAELQRAETDPTADPAVTAAILKASRSLFSAFTAFGILSGQIKPRKPREQRDQRRARV